MILIILAAAIFLRFINLGQSLWFDEAINVLASKNLGFLDFVTVYPIGDFHPPGYFSILWVWTRLFGFSEIAVRMPSIIFSVLTVYLTYLVGEKLYGKKIGLYSAILITLNPLHIYYSQEARMYSLAALAVVLNIYFFVKLLKNDLGFISKIGYILSLGLIFYSDYVAYLIIPTQFIYLIVFQKNNLRSFFTLFLGGLVFLAPWLLIFPNQLSSGTSAAKTLAGWAEVVGGSSFKDLGLTFVKPLIGRITFVDKQIYTLIVLGLGLFYGFLTYKALRTNQKNEKLLLLWILIPTILGFIISMVIPILSYFRMLFIVPALCIIFAKGISSFDRKFEEVMLATAVLISIIFSSLYFISPKFQRENWREAVSFVNELAKRDNGVIVFENNSLFAPYLYYSQEKSLAFAGLKTIPSKTYEDLALLEAAIGKKRTVYLFEYLVDITDPTRLLEGKLNDIGYIKIHTYNFNGVGFVNSYSRI